MFVYIGFQVLYPKFLSPGFKTYGRSVVDIIAKKDPGIFFENRFSGCF
jgi:hypothetical protein